jgi:hypothetical protein
MDGSYTRQFFLEPKLTFQRHYEALRAVFVDAEPIERVAERFGYKASALKSMASRFRADCRRGVTPPFSPRWTWTTMRSMRLPRPSTPSTA